MVKQNQPEATTHPGKISNSFAFSLVTMTLIISLEDVWTIHPGKGRVYHLFSLSYATGHSFDEAQIKFCVLKCSHSVYPWYPSSGSKHLCIRPKNYILNIWLRTEVACLETPLRVCGELQTAPVRRGQVGCLIVSKAHLILCGKTKPWFITQGFHDLGGELGPFISLTHTMLIKYACDKKSRAGILIF